MASVSSGNGLAFSRLILLCVSFTAIAVDKVQAAPFDEATEQYRRFMIADMDQALAGVRALRDCVNARDIPAAKKAWIEARIGWERSEVFTAGFIPELDDAIDAWPDAVTGFHGIEVKLFAANRDDFGVELNQLILYLTEAEDRIGDTELTPQGLLNGITRLAFEIGDSKVDGGEFRGGAARRSTTCATTLTELNSPTAPCSRRSCKRAIRSWPGRLATISTQ